MRLFGRNFSLPGHPDRDDKREVEKENRNFWEIQNLLLEADFNFDPNAYDPVRTAIKLWIDDAFKHQQKYTDLDQIAAEGCPNWDLATKRILSLAFNECLLLAFDVDDLSTTPPPDTQRLLKFRNIQGLHGK